MNFKKLLAILDDAIQTWFDRMRPKEKSSIRAFKWYEKKARRDFERTNGVKLRKDQLLKETDLLELAQYRSYDDALQKLRVHGLHEGYISRLVCIWHYYEIVDTHA